MGKGGYWYGFVVTDESDRVGKEYEWNCISGLVKGLGETSVKKASKYEDTKNGTDCFVDGIRVDFTAAYNHKDHMVRRFTRYNESLDLYFGIRIGNNHGKEFKDFVIVVGNSYDNSFANDYILPNVESFFERNSSAIADAIFDTYCAYQDYLEEAC